jgi:hypothetical protein
VDRSGQGVRLLVCVGIEAVAKPNQGSRKTKSKLVMQSSGGRIMPRKRKRTMWSADDIGSLKSMAKKKQPAAKIAEKLKRTEAATRQKAFCMGLSLDTRG